ncbi:hypothetical protein IQ07DRAFT_642416 [Pyrenochaeta sp. DS3sAY3a]|nr:hypothetical protein IQ07DRAFT_642416 [Pyrenochaeta sp. DS3sAY3a]
MSPSPSDETVLFLFIAFAALIALLLILSIVSCQTWMLWKMAKAVVEQDARLISRRRRGVDVEYGEGALQKRRSVRASWGGGAAGGDEESAMLMSGGRGEKRVRRGWGFWPWR